MLTSKRPPITNSQYKAAIKNDWRYRFEVWRAHNFAQRFNPGPKPRFKRGTGHLSYLGKSGQRAADIRAEIMQQMVLQRG